MKTKYRIFEVYDTGEETIYYIIQKRVKGYGWFSGYSWRDWYSFKTVDEAMNKIKEYEKPIIAEKRRLVYEI